ncbi:unnamed protein product [Rotaria sp. Silwood1]|nr:unnamed protein product [Rotaria sp. Silwood1]CAF0754209.1 unnamed protein product [Rotaria sp. Silwood1]CAF3339753.1 unnamed protein product [Rotaria sp. Silwood1]CAF4590780.1 unnamed protein product [Rotaria sp. Silwood1]
MSSDDSKLFSSIKYFTTGFRDPAIETEFKQHGAIRSFYLTEKTTHVICDDFESNKSELEQAIEIYQTPIVTSNWIKDCLKSNQLLPIDSYRSEENNNDENNQKRLFQSCTFANANLLNEDHNKIYALATYYGGRWIANLDSFVCTHIICASPLPTNHKLGDNNNNHEDIDERLQDAYEIQSEKVHLITPDWILDCINANILFDEANYHPDLLKNSNESMDIDEDDDDNINIRSNDERSSTKDVSQTKSFVSKRSLTTTTIPQRSSKFSVTNNHNGHSSSTKDTHNSILPSEEKLIRPSVSDNLATYKTNLQLSRHAPPETLSYELNYSLQDKHERIPPSQCLLGCVIYIDEREYSVTVSKSDLSTWSQTITKHGATISDDVMNPNLTHFVCAYSTSDLFRQVSKRGSVRMVTAHWLNDVLQKKKLFVPNLAIHYPSPYEPNEPEKLPLTKSFITITGFDGLERARLRYMIRSLGGKYSGHLGRWHTHLIARESGTSEKYLKALEWSIPVVNGLWLSELFLGNTNALKQPLEDRFRRLSGSPPIDHFSFDQSFVHELLLPWSQPIRISDDMLNTAIRRHNEQQYSSFDNDYMKSSYNESIIPLIDSTLTHNGPLLIMLSGFNAKTLNHYETIIKSLGGKISTLPQYTTHLIMNKFLRTEKLYECMGYVSNILNKKWLDKCNDAKCFLPVEESDWLLDDELKPPRNLLKQSIDKRIGRKNKPLFTGYTFFLTPTVQPSQITLKSIIFAHGGNVRRQFPTIKQLTTYDEQTKIPNCLILTCDIDKLLLKDLHKHNNTDFEIKILSIDFVLESIVQQEILNIDSFLMKV